MSHPNLAERARVLAATAKCMEVLAPLGESDQLAVILGLVLTTAPNDDSGRKAVDDLMRKMGAVK